MPAPPSCPRCGYDLSGAIATWVETCPLAVRCSECGLWFQLRLVLNEGLRNQTEFYEAAVRHSLRFLRKTIWRSVRPWLFWRWVVMEHRPRVGRMIAGVLTGMLTVELACLMIAAILIGIPFFLNVYVWASRNPASDYEDAIDSMVRFVAPWARDWQAGEWRGPGATFVILALLVHCVTPFTFVLLPQTLRRARVLPEHLVRIGAWSFVGVPLVLAMYPLLQLIIQTIGWLSDSVFSQTFYGSDLYLASEALAHAYPWIEVALLAGWGLLWYGLAAGRYLKLRTPWLVAASMLTIALLASLLVCILLPGRLWYDIAIRF